MLNDIKISYVNVDQETLSSELYAKVKFYGNVVHWSLIYAIPLFWLLDFTILPDDWVLLLMIRILLAFVSQCVYVYGNLQRNNWDMELVMSVIVGINTVLYSCICASIPTALVTPYFLLFSVFYLMVNISIFWKPKYSIIQCCIGYLVIIFLFYVLHKYDTYGTLISNGGGIFFVISGFSCLLSFNRYQLTKREVAKNIIIDMANNRLIEQNEKIVDQQHEIQQVNRKLNKLSGYRLSTLNMILHDFRNFTGSIQMSLDLLNETKSNFTEEQNEILGYIGVGNEKLKYLSEKLSKSTETEDKPIDYNYSHIDLGKEVEQMVMDLSDAATMKQIKVQVNIDPSATMIYHDKIFLNQVLVKLFSNVIRYANSGTIITLHLHKIENKAIVDIANKGKVLGWQKLDRLFNDGAETEEQQLSLTSQNTSGFSVAKRLTEQMGGKLTYDSDENTGNFYRLEFNLTK